MKKLWRVVAEWDIGQENIVFSSVQKAEEWARQRVAEQDFEETYEDLYSKCLIAFLPVELYE